MIKKFNSETAERGQEVREEVYDAFLNVLPPISLKGGMLDSRWANPYATEKIHAQATTGSAI